MYSAALRESVSVSGSNQARRGVYYELVLANSNPVAVSHHLDHHASKKSSRLAVHS